MTPKTVGFAQKTGKNNDFYFPRKPIFLDWAFGALCAMRLW
jgi:hypothetical protein